MFKIKVVISYKLHGIELDHYEFPEIIVFELYLLVCRLRFVLVFKSSENKRSMRSSCFL